MKIVTGPPNLRDECRCALRLVAGMWVCYRVSASTVDSNGETVREISSPFSFRVARLRGKISAVDRE